MSTDPRDPVPLTATRAVRPVRRLKLAAGVLGLILLLLLVLATAGRPWLETYGWGRTFVNETVGRAGLGSDPDFVLVTNAVDEALYDRTWKLVRWWAGRPSQSLHEESIQAMREQIDEHRQWAEKNVAANLGAIADYHRGHARILEDELQKLVAQQPSTICRIQYAVYENAGKTTIRDEIFLIDKGLAWPVPEAYKKKALQEFPE